MRILITGASGMLGATLVEKWQNKFDIYATDKGNFANNPAKHFLIFDLLNESYKILIDWAEPDVIIHCAAVGGHRLVEDTCDVLYENIMMFVALHELAHIMTKSVGHTDEFWDNFRYLLKKAIKLGVYKDVNFEKNPVDYCGTKITNSPL